MKISNIAIVIIAVASIATSVSAHAAQRSRTGRTVVAKTPGAVPSELVSAIESMEAALPVYNGHRTRAIRFAHSALEAAELAFTGSKAPVSPLPNVNDTVPSTQADSVYSMEQISQSLSNMRAGLFDLESALNMLRSIVGNKPNKQAALAEHDIQEAIKSANAAIRLHFAAP